MKCHALIAAAGSGSRFGAVQPKQYVMLAGRPVIAHVLEAFQNAASVDQVHAVIAPHDGRFAGLFAKTSVLRCGGASRMESVRNALVALRSGQGGDPPDEEDWILVHDAARPNISAALIDHLVTSVGNDAVGGLLALPVADTLKREQSGRVAETVLRTGLWQAQTPQMFRFSILLKALCDCDPGQFTDEASAIESLGLSPMLVTGSPRNFKLTWPDDLLIAEAMMRAS